MTIKMTTYKIARNGTVIGEYNSDTIQQLINDKTLFITDYGWTEGMNDWKPLNVLGYRLYISSTPSPPNLTDTSFVQKDTVAGQISMGIPPPN